MGRPDGAWPANAVAERRCLNGMCRTPYTPPPEDPRASYCSAECRRANNGGPPARRGQLLPPPRIVLAPPRPPRRDLPRAEVAQREAFVAEVEAAFDQLDVPAAASPAMTPPPAAAGRVLTVIGREACLACRKEHDVYGLQPQGGAA